MEWLSSLTTIKYEIRCSYCKKLIDDNDVWFFIMHNPREEDKALRMHFFCKKGCGIKWCKLDRDQRTTGEFK